MNQMGIYEGGGEPGGWDRVKNDDQAISFDSLPEAASGNNTAESRGGNEKKETFALLTQYSAETPAVGAGMIHRGSREQTATDTTLPPERIY